MLVNSPSFQISRPLSAPHAKMVSNGDELNPSRSSEGQNNVFETESSDNNKTQQQEISQQAELRKLKNIDREVRAHELAHLSAAGQYATSGASFSYQKGSDGRLYAVSGEVGIDSSAIPGDPRATLRKAQTVMRAALAPANPSAQDRRVAAQASAMALQARVELSLQQEGVAPREPGQYLDAFA